ncbi:MAG: PDZ domain-containing protein, partial [Flavobacteriales bacterium]
MPVTEGIHVIGIHPGSPCDAGGLWYGDVILSVNEQKLDKDWKIKVPKNEIVELEVKRCGAIHRMNLSIDFNLTFFKGQRLIIRK